MFEDKVSAFVDKVSKDFDPKAIIVFGSVAKGTATEDSDLDVAVILDTDLSWTERVIAIRRSLGRFGVALDLLVFTPEEIEAEKNNPCTIVSEILSTGKVVYGTA
ncbi:MAG: nucleotidyltransferase domain-containing protein [Thermoplasmata archaeon]|nr:nucleotidyltransferase domain-containing protein [Thermoplasmata archaeon]